MIIIKKKKIIFRLISLENKIKSVHIKFDLIRKSVLQNTICCCFKFTEFSFLYEFGISICVCFSLVICLAKLYKF